MREVVNSLVLICIDSELTGASKVVLVPYLETSLKDATLNPNLSVTLKLSSTFRNTGR